MSGTPEVPTKQELLKVIAIDRKRKVLMEAELRDSEGGLVDIVDTAETLADYVVDKMKNDGENSVQKQVFPLMAKACAATLCHLQGEYAAGLMLSQPQLRNAFLDGMMTAFFFRQFISKNDLKIYTSEEELTDDDIEHYDRVSAASGVAAMAAQLGANPKDVIRELLKSGAIKAEDLKALGAESVLKDEDEEAKDNN